MIRSLDGRRFWLLAGLTFAGYALLLAWMPLAPWAAQVRRPDISSFAGTPLTVTLYIALLAALFVLYWAAYRYAQKHGERLGLAAVLGPSALFCLLLLGVFPFNALDIYNYLILGRVQAVFGFNPYLVPPNAIPQDPFLVYVGEWGGGVSPYGPVFQYIADALALLAGNHLLLGLLLFKAVAALALLGSAALIWHLLADQTQATRVAATLLWAWNPAVLLSLAANGHNDGVMIFGLLLGWLLLVRGRRTLGFVVLLLAAWTKLSGLLPAPFLALAALRAHPNLRDRWRTLALWAVSGAAVTALLFLPFGSPLGLLQRLLGTATGAGYSPLTLVLMTAQDLGHPLRQSSLALAGAGLFVAVALWLLWRAWRGRSPVRGAADISAAYVALALGFRIWYALWPFPWLALDPPISRVARARLHAGLAFLVTSQFSVLIYGQLRRALLGGSRYQAHWIGVLVTFGLPVLVGIWSWSRARGQETPPP